MRTTLRPLVFIAVLAVCAPAQAGRLKKAFAALQVHNYFLARELFLKEVGRQPAAANYGLSVITGRADNPFYQLDSSYAYIQRADAAFTLSSEKVRNAIRVFGVDAAAIQEQKDHIHTVAWDQVRAVNTVEAYTRYIERYPASPKVGDASLVRDHLAFQEAREQNTAEGYRRFLERYPGARETFEARNRFQEAVFREATPNGTIAELEAFIASDPESPYVRNAEEAIYKACTPHRSPGELSAFIRRYPHSPLVPDAWRALYEASVKDLSAASITAFLQQYPDFPFMNELVADYNVASLELHPFRRQGRWGYLDSEGVERI